MLVRVFELWSNWYRGWFGNKSLFQLNFQFLFRVSWYHLHPFVEIYIIRLLNDYFQWFWLWCGCLLRSVFFKSWLEILLLFETLFFFYFFGWSCMWTIHERKHLLRLYYNLRDSPQTLAQPMNWKCSLLFIIIGQLLLLTLYSFLFRNSKKTHI